MKYLPIILIAMLGVAASAEEKKKTFDAFAMMKSRNIFDPNRRPVRTETREPQRESRSRPNWIALTGTMVTDDKAYAFFNSSRAEARKVAKVGDMVGEFKVLSVTPVQVEWEHEGKRSVLAVGRQVDTSGTFEEVIEPPPSENSSESHTGGVPSGDMSQAPRTENSNRSESQYRERERGDYRDRGGDSRDRERFQRGGDQRDRSRERGSYNNGGNNGGSNSNGSSGSAPSAAPSSSSNPSETMRLMMERRQKELSK